MNRFTIQRATIDDIGIVVHQRKQMFEDMGVTDSEKLAQMSDAFVEWVYPKLASEEYVCWYAVDGTEVIGGLGLFIVEWMPGIATETRKRGYVYNVHIDAEYMDAGVDQALIDTVVAWSQKNGITKILLNAKDRQRPLYDALGFEETSEAWMRL